MTIPVSVVYYINIFSDILNNFIKISSLFLGFLCSFASSAASYAVTKILKEVYFEFY